VGVIDLVSHSVDDTCAIASAIARLARPGDMIVLSGEMGAGKTAFARGFADGLGVSRDDHIASPTFNLVHVHETGRIPLHHADLHRLGSTAEVADLGLGESADLGAVILVEWGDMAADVLGDHLTIALEAIDDDAADERAVNVSVEGHAWDQRWERLRGALADWTVGR
jgi:tRNA threonylcarbamoyladenosine biosynthesis protein TsaE